MMLRNSYKTISETETLAYILRFVSEGKDEDQIVKIFNGDKQLVKTCIETLREIHFVATNFFNEMVITPDGKTYLEKFDLHC